MYWAAARLEPHRERLATYTLQVAGFANYSPHIRERRIVHGRKIEAKPALFPGYLFIEIEAQWHAARWSPGVAALVMSGQYPAKVPDAIINELRARERNGLIELPSRLDPTRIRPGTSVRITRGPLLGLSGLCVGMAPRERLLVLFTILNARREV